MKLEGSEFKEVKQPVDVPAVDLEKKEKAESIFKDIFSRPLGDLIDKYKEKTFDKENISPEVPSDEAPTKKAEISNTDSLTPEEKADIQEKTGWSDDIIDFIGSKEEAEIYMKADLKEVEINGKKCLIRDDIDLDQKDEDGISNRERMERGRPPITKDGEEVELHHIGQKQNSPLAELTMEQHRGVGNDTILHDKTKETEIDRNEFGKERREYWKDRVDAMEGGD